VTKPHPTLEFTFETDSMSDEEGFVDVSFAQDGGVLKKILKEAPEGASGPPPNGTEVEAHYTGTWDSCRRAAALSHMHSQD
jgi:hypothetical protein